MQKIVDNLLSAAGGMIGDAIDIRAPFDVAFVSFLLASIYARLALPYISPESMSDGKKAGQQRGISAFLAPLKILVPQRLRLADGRLRKHYGVIFLGTVGSYALNAWALARTSASTTAFFIYVQPVFAGAFAYFALGEEPSPRIFGAAALIFAGVALAIWPARKPPAP